MKLAIYALPVGELVREQGIRIVLINEDILVNEDNFVCSKIRIVCMFEDVFFLWSSGGQGLQIGLLKVLKMDSLSKNTPSSPSTFGGCPSSPRNYIDFYDYVLYEWAVQCSDVYCCCCRLVRLAVSLGRALAHSYNTQSQKSM